MYHLSGDMNLTYMYMYVKKKAYAGSAKGLRMATNFVNIDGHNFLIFIDGSEHWNEKYAQTSVLFKTIAIDLFCNSGCGMYYMALIQWTGTVLICGCVFSY